MQQPIRILAVLVALALYAIVADDAFARARMYHPEMGRFMQRDPHGTPIASVARTGSGPAVIGSGFIQRDYNPHRQYTDGMNLYQNDYMPTQSDKREIIEYSSPKIIGSYVDRIFESLRKPHGIRTTQNTESHFVAVNGDGTWRTIRWLPFVDNDNMAFAYGGADIIGVGEVDLNRRLVTDKELLMSEITGWFSVRIRDYYR